MAERTSLSRPVPPCQRLLLGAVAAALHLPLWTPASTLGAEPPTRPSTGQASPAISPTDTIANDPFTLTPPPGAQAGSELLLFQDMPIVISAARQAQPMNLSAVPVSILTSDDIHYSGRTNVPNLLQFVPGMDVVRSDRNSYAVGVHGLHHNFADRTLTLINGRSAGNPLFGGADWTILPVLMEDIQRIEVVRGPGGAVWGANALNGVVNIITKQPKDIRGIFVSSTVDNYGDTYSMVRWAEVSGNWAWRVSVGYQDQKSSDQAIGDDARFNATTPLLGPLLAVEKWAAEDLLRDLRTDSELAYTFSSETKASFGLASSSYQRGETELLGFLSDRRNDGDMVRAYARLDYTPDKHTSAYLQWFANFENAERPSLVDYWDVENDLESQVSFGLGETNTLTLGGNIRAVQVAPDQSRPTDMMGSFNAHETWAGLYAVDHWQINHHLALEGQLRGDWYSATGGDWSGRLTGLYAVDDAKHHILRLGAAKAFRAPPVGFRRLQGQRVPFPAPAPAGMALFNLVPSEDLQNEEVYALEAGYNAQLADGLMFRLDSFYHHYEDLIGGLSRSGSDFRQYMYLDNLGAADGIGGEAELSYTLKRLRLSVWYSYEHFTTEHDDQDTRSFYPTEHQAGASARWSPGDGWTLNANYKYTGNAYSSVPESSAGSSNTLDLSVAKSLFNNRAEIMLGIDDVFDQTGSPVPQDGQVTSHESPGRIVFIRLQGRY